MSIDDARDKAEEFARVPLGETNLSTRLIRSLTRAGCKSLKDAFDKDELIIEDAVGNSFREFTKLVDNYYDNPALFVDLMSRAKPAKSESQSLAHKQQIGETITQSRKSAAPQARRIAYVDRTALDNPYGQFLLSNQRKAREIFDDLCDRHESVLVYQAFPSFSVELEEIRTSFFKLFVDYSGKALDISEQRLPDLFLIFVADLARDSFADDNLWGNFFDAFPLKVNEKNQANIKKLFVNLLRRKGMPLYSQDEAAYYYFYTALLHGGLSEESWEDLWEISLIPLAKELRLGGVGYAGEFDGYEILKELKRDEGPFAPKKESVAKILEKASRSTLAPLLESALKLALETESKAQAKDDFMLMESHGLPEVAVASLNNVYEKRAQSGSRSANEKGKGSAQRLVSLPSAELCLDLELGSVLITWPRKKYPLELCEDKIEIFMGQEKLGEQRFEMHANQCVLEEMKVKVPPQSRYDVELRWMRHLGDGVYELNGSPLEQFFLRSKPGCFEFICGVDGVFRLRERKDRINKKRRVAYVVKEGYYIIPGAGMTSIAKFETGHAWAGNSVFLYDVAPGASGAIYKTVEGAKDEEVAVWQESYRAHINKRRIVGETLEGLDLYGFAYAKDAGNVGLPRIEIEAADGLTAFDDLEIVGLCDGEPFSVPREVLWEDSYGITRASRIALPLERASRINWHAKQVEIIAYQKSAGGNVVFRYRFATIPIQDFRLEEAHVDNGIVVAWYSFRSRLNIRVQDSGGVQTNVLARNTYSKQALLKDEFMLLSIISEDGSCQVNAKLALAAVDIVLPEELAALSRKRPLCLADALTLGASKGEIIIKALGWRNNRNMIVALKACGSLKHIFSFRELHQPSVHSVNVFSHPGTLVPAGSSVHDCPLTISVDYGDEDTDYGPRLARTDIELLRCREGVGFKDFQTSFDGSNFVLKFDKPVLCNCSVSFRREGRKPVDLGTIMLSKGATELVVPEDVTYTMKIQKPVVVTFSPKSRMGKAQQEYSFEVPLKG